MEHTSHVAGPVSPFLESTMGDAIRDVARRFPDRLALISRHQNVRLTWRNFDQAIDETARGLAGLGLNPGDRVGIWASNCVEWILTQMACARAGFVLVNVNPAYRSYDLRFVLKKSRTRALVLWEKDARANYREILEEARAGEDLTLEHTIWLGTDSWTRMLENPAEISREPISATDPVNIQYTSGTTGTPKGVLLTHRNLVNNAWITGEWLAVTEQDVTCNPCPLYHCAGSVVAALTTFLRGGAVILPSAQFDARAVLQSIHDERATILGGVPTMFIAELEHPDFAQFNFDSMRSAWMGGAPCPPDLLRRVTGHLHCERVAVLYGQTESSPLITMSPPEDSFEQCMDNVGCVAPNTEVKIVSITGETVPVGEQGELCTRGYLVMKGYDDEPEATARTIDKEGWLRTGDLATISADGHVRITGRAKEMIIRGGENVYPREIEDYLYTHPQVAEVAVLGLPDPRLGEVVIAWIRPAKGASLTEDDIRAFCAGKIAHFKIPQQIRFVDSFPTTVSGKVQKFRIREIEMETAQAEGAPR